MLTDEERHALATSKLVIACPCIEIVPHDPLTDPSYFGSGELELAADSVPRFQLSGDIDSPGQRVLLPMSGIRRTSAQQPHFRATDAAGRVWSGRAELCTIPFLDSPQRGIARILRHVAPCSASAPALRLLLRADVNIPTCVWQLATDEGLITLRKSQRHLEVTVVSERDVPPDFYMRLEEALWFVTGSLASAGLVERREKDEMHVSLHEPVGHVATGLFGFPLKPLPSNAVHLGEMYLRYLRYVSQGPEGHFHPTSADLRILLAGPRRTIEQSALLVSVALEALVNRHFNDRRGESPSALKLFQDATPMVAKLEIDDKVKKRLLGALKRMTEPSSRTALRRLAEEGPLLLKHWDAWEAIRHRFAHALAQDEKDWDTVIGQVLLVAQAFTALILAHIGYRGPMSDVTRPHWPPIRFPLERTETA